MKQINFIFVSVYWCLASCSQNREEWNEVALDEHVSVQVPGVVERQTLNKTVAPGRLQTTNMFLSKDAKARYQAVVFYDSDSTIDLASKEAQQSFYDGAVRALLAGQQNSRVLKLSAFPTAVGTGVETKFRAIHLGTGKMVTKYSRLLLVGRVGYAFNFTAEGQDPADVERMRFYNSIFIKTKTPAD